VFPQVHGFATRPDTPEQLQNIVFIIANDDTPLPLPDSRSLGIMRSDARNLGHMRLDLATYDHPNAHLLTDDKAPVELLGAQQVNRYYATLRSERR